MERTVNSYISTCVLLSIVHLVDLWNQIDPTTLISYSMFFVWFCLVLFGPVFAFCHSNCPETPALQDMTSLEEVERGLMLKTVNN